jgi:hypothetical protein
MTGIAAVAPRSKPFSLPGQGKPPARIEAVIFWVVVDLCIYFDDSKSLPSKGLHA